VPVVVFERRVDSSFEGHVDVVDGQAVRGPDPPLEIG
jgi:hypothetical protein